MFDGIEYRGSAQGDVEQLAAYANVPVWNGLTDQWHPTQLLADVLTIMDHVAKPLEDVVLCYVGDARNNTANSTLVVGALLDWTFASRRRSHSSQVPKSAVSPVTYRVSRGRASP